MEEYLSTFDMNHFLYLRFGANFTNRRVMEVNIDSGWGRIIDESGEGGKWLVGFVTEEERNTTKMTVVLCLDTNLDEGIFVQNTFVGET